MERKIRLVDLTNREIMIEKFDPAIFHVCLGLRDRTLLQQLVSPPASLGHKPIEAEFI